MASIFKKIFGGTDKSDNTNYILNRFTAELNITKAEGEKDEDVDTEKLRNDYIQQMEASVKNMEGFNKATFFHGFILNNTFASDGNKNILVYSYGKGYIINVDGSRM